MSVELEIQDGSPWYLSPNIWTVPGDDPEGVPGMPIVGESCYMWARVRNNGSTPVTNATVRFYWANPSVGFDRTTANAIGNANVSLAAGEARDVLCLTPWLPVYVNQGHECVLAEAFHTTADPLPTSPAFNVPTDRHVAQRNLQVVMAMKSMLFTANFSVCNTVRTDRAFTIQAKPGRLEELRPLLKHVGKEKLSLSAKGTVENLGFVTKPCPDPEDLSRHALPVVENMTVKGNTCSGLTLTGQLKGDAALVHVTQEVDGKEIGGLSIVVVKAQPQNKEAK